MRDEVLQELHARISSGHLGEKKVMGKLHKHFYWPGQWKDVHNWCQTYATRATRKTETLQRRVHLGNICAGYSMQVVAVDVMGPLPESTVGNSYILVDGDYSPR